jgi:hypothetical protein
MIDITGCSKVEKDNPQGQQYIGYFWYPPTHKNQWNQA